MRRLSDKCVIEGSKSAHWIGLYLSFHLRWVLGPFVHGRIQNLKTNEDTFGHDIAPLRFPSLMISALLTCQVVFLSSIIFELSWLMDPLSLRLIGAVEARINLRGHTHLGSTAKPRHEPRFSWLRAQLYRNHK